MTDYQQHLGITSKEADERLKKYGPNEIEKKDSISFIKILFDQLKSPLIYILVFAGIVSFYLREYTDSIIIFAAVAINTFLGFWQEAKAENSLMALRKLIVLRSWVVRDGIEKKILSKEIVPGDVVVLKTGDKVPADGILLEAIDLHINEAILTGESLAVKKLSLRKDQLNESWDQLQPEKKAFMGTVVLSGRGKLLVYQTGMRTKMGEIASGLKDTIEEETPLQLQISKLSKILALVMFFICLFIFIEGLIFGGGFLEMLTLSAAVAVAAIPEGLVIAVTTILVLGMQRLLAKKALVRKLLAAETL